MNLWLRLVAVSAAVKQNVSILADNLVLGTPEHPVIVITQPVGVFSICVCVRVCVHVCVRVCVHMYVRTNLQIPQLPTARQTVKMITCICIYSCFMDGRTLYHIWECSKLT